MPRDGSDKGFWGDEPPAKKPGPPPGDSPGEFCEAPKPPTDTPATWAAPTPARPPAPTDPALRKRRRRKILFYSLGGAGVAILILLLLAPTIAGWLTPWAIRKYVPVAGSLEVESVSLSWFGTQRIGEVRLKDTDGSLVARVGVEIPAGLMALARGNYALGDVKLSGSADIVRFADGTTNIERAIGPRPPKPPPPYPPSVPPSLSARLSATRLAINYTDQGSAAGGARPARPPLKVSLMGVDIDASAKAGGEITLKLTAQAQGPSGPPGDLALSINAKNWSDASGKLLVDSQAPYISDRTSAEIDLRCTQVPLTIADAALGWGDRLASALGDRADAHTTYSGGVGVGKLTLTAAAPGATASAELQLVSGQLRSLKPIEIAVKGRAIDALSPAVHNLTSGAAGARQQLDAAPDTRISIDSLRLRSPIAGGLDLRGAAALITAQTAAVTGRAQIDEGRWSPFVIAPAAISLRTDDLAAAARLTFATHATLDGKDAGTIDADFNLSGLLDPAGKLVAGVPGGVSGRATLARVATSIAQPFVEASGLDLPADLGPVLDITLNAQSSAGASAGSPPPASVDLAVRSQNATITGEFTLSPDRLKTRGAGVRIESVRAAAIARRFAGESFALALAPSGSLTATITDLDIPLDPSTRKPRLAEAGATLSASAPGWSLSARDGARPDPLALRTLDLSARLAPGQPARAELKAKASYRGVEFPVNAAVESGTLAGLLAQNGSAFNVDTLRPTASLDITGAPVELASMVAPAAAPGAPPPKLTPQALASMLRQMVGDAAEIHAAAKPAADGSLSLTASLAAPRLRSDLAAGLSKDRVSLRSFAADATVTPEALRSVYSALDLTPQTLPGVAQPATLHLAMDPAELARGDKTFLADTTGQTPLTLRVTSASPLVIDGLSITRDGKPQSLGRVSADGVSITASVPLGLAMNSKGAHGAVKLDASAKLSRTAGPALGNLAASVSGSFAGYTPDGPLDATLRLDAIHTRTVDEMLALATPIGPALGDSAAAAVVSTITVPRGETWARAAVTADLTLTSPRLSTPEGQPLRLEILPDRMTVPRATTLNWIIDPSMANSLLAPARPQDPQALRVTERTTATVSIAKLSISRGTGPLMPGVFALDAGISLPSLKLVAPDERATTLTGVRARAATDAKGLGFTVEIAEALAPDAPAAKNLRLEGSVSDFAAADGAFSKDTARLSASGTLAAVPTALLDALARQNGLLADALGPTTNVEISADRFGVKGGSVRAKAVSPRAVAELAGAVQDGTFTGDRATPFTARITEITPQFSARFVKSLPLIGSFEKKPADAPAMVEISGVRAPLADNSATPGDERLLIDADISVDPGEISFNVSQDFAGLLSIANQKTTGTAGRKLEPLQIQIRAGQARLQRWTVPLGEFRIPMEGTFNLATREIDFITYIPVGALSAEAGARVKGVAGALVGDALKNALVPVRTRGTMDNRRTQMDLELFAKEFVKSIKPEDVIQKGLEQLIKPKK